MNRCARWNAAEVELQQALILDVVRVTIPVLYREVSVGAVIPGIFPDIDIGVLSLGARLQYPCARWLVDRNIGPAQGARDVVGR